MANASYLQSSFLAGEWSKAAQGNLTDPRYKTALSTCLNMVLLETGAMTRRPGTMHAGRTRAGHPARVLPFDFQESSPYTMEFTDGMIRFRNGISLIGTNDDRTVVTISTANPAVVETDAAHGWATGNSVLFTFGDTTSPILQGYRLFTITVVDSTHFSLVGGVTGQNIDGVQVAWATPSIPVKVRRVLELQTVYATNDWQSLRSVQGDKVAVLLTNDVPPYALSVNTLPNADTGAAATFSLTPANFHDGPYLDPVSNGMLVTPSALTGSVNLTFSFATWLSTKNYGIDDCVTYSGENYQSLIDGNINNQPDISPTAWSVIAANSLASISGADVGRHIRLFSEPPDWLSATTYVANQVVKFNNAYWVALTGMTGATPSAGQINPNQPGVKSTTWAPASQVARWTWGKVTGLSNSISGATGTNIGDFASRVANAFDGITNQQLTVAAITSQINVGPGGVSSRTNYIGKNYTGSSKTISAAVLYPSVDLGLVTLNYPGFTALKLDTLRVTLLAKATAPASAYDGTILADTTLSTNSFVPIVLNSSDSVTTWNYVWVAISATVENDAGLGANVGIFYLSVAEVKFFNAPDPSTANGVTVSILGDDLLYTTILKTWRLGVFTTGTYPTCGTYHEGRLWLSGAVDNRFDSSALVDIDNNPTIDLFTFAPTIADGTVTGGNAISYTFNAPDINAIFWMQPDHQGIICGTQAGEWLVQATTLNEPLTPTNIQAHRVTKIGCANIEPARAPLTTILVQRHKRRLQEYFSDVFSGRFTSPDLSQNAKHLTAPSIEEISYQQEISPTIWARMGDGDFVGIAYKRESLFSSQGPNFNGWHRHTLGSGRTVESMRVTGNHDGSLDSPIMVTNDSTNIRHVELMNDVFQEGDTITSAWFLDDAIAATSYSTGSLSGGGQGVKANGFWHLNGNTVSIFAGGVDVGDFLVTNGTVEIPYGSDSNGLFTSSFVAAFNGAMVIVGGFTYNSDGQVVPPDTNPESGARNGPGFGKVRRVHKFAASLVNAQAMSFGTDFTRLHKAQFRTPGGTAALAANVLFTGTHKDTIDDKAQSLQGQMCWRISRPLPATIAGIGAFLQTEDE